MKKVRGLQVVTGAEALELALPVEIQEALGALVGAAREGLLALSVGGSPASRRGASRGSGSRSARTSSRPRRRRGSRRCQSVFIERTRTALQELISRRFDDVRLAVMMLDGLEIADRTHIVALGITTDGVKIPLGLWEGSTENATLAREHVIAHKNSTRPRFEEQVTDAPPVVGSLYLRKYALNRLGNADCLRVTVEAAAAGAVRPLVPVAKVAEAGS